MAANNVLGVTKTPANQQDGVVRASGSKSEKEKSQISFMDMLNISGKTLPQANVSANTGKDVGVSGAQSKSDSFNNSYDPYASPNSKIEVKEELTAERLQTESKDTLDEFGEEVNQVLEDELGVTEEQIQAVLQELGLTAMDLMDPKNLTMLVQKLTGMQDIGTLLMSGSFQNIMEQVTALTQDLCSELGVTMEELTTLCKEMTENKDIVQPDKDAVTMSDQEKVDQKAVKETQGQIINQTSQIQTEEAVQTVVKQPEDSTNESAQTIQQEQNTTETLEETQQMEERSEDASQNGKNNSQENDSAKDSFSGKSAEHVANTSSVTNIHAQAVQPFAMEAAQAAYTGQVDIADIIEQVTRNAKVAFTAELTSMEMQLNPENLGKIYLHITQKEGSLRAEIAAQSETVKNALEAQVAELRQSLNQHGVKVDAIEVTVATHEFEQNLDSNARQEEQLQQQMEETSKKNRRSLNLNDLDQLSGLMTEEETLVTKMMQENGNQVDLNA